MNILNKFINRSLKLNKKRTIVTIIGIALSTALITATVGLVSSFQTTLLNKAIEDNGNYYVEFYGNSKEAKDKLLENNNIKDYMLTQNAGFSVLKDSKNKYKPYLFIKEYDEKAFKEMPITLKSGEMPKNSNEIIISEHIISNAEVNYKIGDEIELNVGDRIAKGDNGKLGNDAALLENRETGNIEEYVNVKFTKKYKIVGIMERLTYNQEGYSAPGYTVISKMEKENENINVLATYKNVLNTYKITDEIIENTQYKVKYNSDVLRYSGVAKNMEMNAMIYTVAAIVIGIIVFSSVFVIRNGFNISVTEKYKQYGMLASIGATPKQIKKNVLREGWVLGAIAIPLGILGASFAVFVLSWLINLILGEYLNGIKFTFNMPIWAIIIGVVMSTVTIYLSCIIPAKRASKISPIDAIRSNQDIKVKKKKLKISPVFKKIFNIGGQISLKNLKRNKKKYRTTVISLVVSIIIFISLSSILDYGFNMGNTYYNQLNYNMRVTVKVSKDVENIEYKNILKLPNIKSYSYWMETTLGIDMKKYINEGLKERYSHLEDISVRVISLNSEEYNRVIKEIGGSVEKYKGKGILIDQYAYYDNGKRKTGDFTNIKESEKILLSNNAAVEVVKRTDYKPMGLDENYTGTVMLIIQREDFDELLSYKEETTNMQNEDSDIIYVTSSLCINSSNPEKLESDIEELLKDNCYITNYDEFVKENKAIMLIISIFLYGFITVITLIGVTNIFNTITTNMALRSKEFAMLKSIGMTKKEFNNMIRLESILYGTKSLLIGIPLGLILSYIIYSVINSTQEMLYVFPIIPIIICILFVFIIVSLTMKYSLKKINEQNIIETIRNENI